MYIFFRATTIGLLQSPPEFFFTTFSRSEGCPAKPTSSYKSMPTHELAFRLLGKKAAVVGLFFFDGLLLLS